MATGTHTYTWDAEGKMTAAASGGSQATYVYNALGQRAEKKVGTVATDYAYDPAGRMAGLEINSSWQEEYIYLGARLFAKYQSGGAVFVHPNALGSVGTLTNNSGQPVQIETEYPWGQQWKLAGPVLNEQFAGMQERDEETGNDPTPNRTYASSLGRWLSPDPGGMKVVSLTDPQTWNMYAYAGDNPTSRTDPTGLCWNWLFPSCAKVQWGEHKQAQGAKKGWWESLWDGKPPQQQSLSPAGLKFIEQHETVGGQPNLTAYDASGKKHLGDWSIGYGHKIRPSEDFSGGINAGQAADLLKGDVQTAVNAVNSALKYPTTFQSQFDAMVSLAYNIGSGAFANSTLVQRWNSGGVVEQPDLFTRWSRTSGAFSPGLYARREEEYTLFNTGEYP